MHQINGSIVADTPEKVKAYRLLALKAALKLELVGLKVRRGFSAFATVKQEFGLKGSKASVLEQYTEILRGMFPGVVK